MNSHLALIFVQGLTTLLHASHSTLVVKLKTLVLHTYPCHFLPPLPYPLPPSHCFHLKFRQWFGLCEKKATYDKVFVVFLLPVWSSINHVIKNGVSDKYKNLNFNSIQGVTIWCSPNNWRIKRKNDVYQNKIWVYLSMFCQHSSLHSRWMFGLGAV